MDLESLSPEEYSKAMEVREKAKNITALKQEHAIFGRLGLIIDGTGKDFGDIKRKSESLRSIGYDTYMIFVNTSLEVAMQRNRERRRTVPENIVVDSWNAVQSNMGKFQSYFTNRNFIIVDNNNATEDVLLKVWKSISKFVDEPIKNRVAQDWIDKELEMKRRQ
jgi:hypothetical protein